MQKKICLANLFSIKILDKTKLKFYTVCIEYLGNCTRFGETELSWQIARAGNEYTYFSLKEWSKIFKLSERKI